MSNPNQEDFDGTMNDNDTASLSCPGVHKPMGMGSGIGAIEGRVV